MMVMISDGNDNATNNSSYEDYWEKCREQDKAALLKAEKAYLGNESLLDKFAVNVHHLLYGALIAAGVMFLPNKCQSDFHRNKQDVGQSLIKPVRAASFVQQDKRIFPN